MDMRDAKRPVLILVRTIKDSIEFSDLLTRQEIPHLLLNEMQIEDETYVLHKAGQTESVTVATNTAGRGTDIKLSKSAIHAGGLHVIYGCFPVNLRVECQGLGRSGRQGQPGSNQIFLSLDEELVQELCKTYIPEFPSATPTVEQLYDARSQDVQKISLRRKEHCAQERVRYKALRFFFTDQQWLALVLHPNQLQCKSALAELSTSVQMMLSEDEFCNRLRECFRLVWTQYFTSLTNGSVRQVDCHESAKRSKGSTGSAQPFFACGLV